MQTIHESFFIDELAQSHLLARVVVLNRDQPHK